MYCNWGEYWCIFVCIYIYIHTYYGCMQYTRISVYLYNDIIYTFVFMYWNSICNFYLHHWFLHVHIYITNCTVGFWSFFQYDNDQSWCITSIKGFEKTNFAIWPLSGLNSHVAHNKQAPRNKPSILDGALVISWMYFFSSLIFKMIRWYLKNATCWYGCFQK